jgi:hypothetical protein
MSFGRKGLNADDRNRIQQLQQYSNKKKRIEKSCTPQQIGMEATTNIQQHTHTQEQSEKEKRGLRVFLALPIEEMKQFAFLWSERIKRAAQGISRALLTRHCH